MALNGQYGVGIILKGKDELSPEVRKGKRSIMLLGQQVTATASELTNAFGTMGIGVSTFTASFRAMKALFGVAKEAGKFEQELAAVKVIMNATTEEFKALETAAIKAGLETQFSPLEAAKALRALGQAGLDAKSAMDTLNPALDLAASSLGALSPERAAGVANAAMKTFGIETKNARSAVDAMVFTTNRFNVSIQDLPLAIGNMSRGVISLKQDMDDSLISLGLVKNVIPNISKASTLTSSAMLRLADKTVMKRMTQLGVTFQDAQGKFLPFIEIVQNLDAVLNKKFSSETKRTGEVVKLLGKQGIAPFSIITKQLSKGIAGLPPGFDKGSKAVQFMRLQFRAAKGDMKAVEEMAKIGVPKAIVNTAREMVKAGGASKQFRDTLLNTFTGQLKLLEGAVQSFLIAVGKPLGKVFRPFVEMALGAFTFLTNYINSMDDSTKKTVATIVTVFVGAIGLAGSLLAVKGAMLFLPALLKIVFGLFATIGVKVAIIVGALWLLKQAWDNNFLGMKTALTSFWEGFSGTFGMMISETLPVLKQAFTTVFKAIGDLMFQLGLTSKKASDSEGWKTFGAIVGAVIGGLAKGFAVLLNTIAQMIAMVTKLFNLLAKVTSFKELFGKAGNLAKGAINSIANSAGYDNVFNVPTTGATSATTPAIGPKITPPTAGQTNTQTIMKSPEFQEYYKREFVLEFDGEKFGRVLEDKATDNRQTSYIRTPVRSM